MSIHAFFSILIVILIAALMALYFSVPKSGDSEGDTPAEPCEHCGCADDVTCEECAATEGRGRRK